MVRVRFAPSPTGMLHIGGARTALFNYIFAKVNNGKFLLRIEDTDKERSTNEATKAILDGMSWLGLEHDEDIIYQSSRHKRHIEIANQLIKEGKAYYAYDTKEELNLERQESDKNHKSYRYSGKWRNQDLQKPNDVKPVIRIKVPKGEIIVKDLIKGEVKFTDEAIDDFIIVRSDGTPTYMFAVVVDDIDMKISHIIRGDDHLSNTPKQIVIYNAIGTECPQFGHIPLIFDSEGTKMSKRKNAVAVSDYANLGILPNALKNYLLNLGWSYKGGDIISQDEAIRQFNITDVGSSASRFDIDKLYNINLHYIKNSSNSELINLIQCKLEEISCIKLNVEKLHILSNIMPELKKCNNINDIISNAIRYIKDEIEYTQEALDVINKDKNLTKAVISFVKTADLDNFKSSWDEFLKENNLKFGQVGPILRSMLIGITSSTALTAIISALPKDIIKQRIAKILI